MQHAADPLGATATSALAAARVSPAPVALQQPLAWRWIGAGLGLLAGSAAQLQQPALWAASSYPLLVAAGLLLALAALRAARLGPVLWALAFASAAFGATGWRAGERLADALPAALEGEDLLVTGVVASLPQQTAEAWRFVFDTESARHGGQPVTLPQRLSIGWYGQAGGPPLPAVRAGQRWQFVLRLKRPHGFVNPNGFDYELLLFEQQVRATGSVRSTPSLRPRLLDEATGHWLDRLRQQVRDAILEHVPDRAAAGVLAALVVGDQAAISREDWALYRDTGIAHLVSISGLHVTMFAWLAGGVVGWCWRRSGRAMRWWPTPWAAQWGGLIAACGYAAFAGWGVPAQRTVLMLVTATAIGGVGLRWAWPLRWGAAAVAVTVLDPWALLQPGFWLSFMAVGLLLASGDAPKRVAELTHDTTALPRWRLGLRSSGAAVWGGIQTQAVASIGLAPLSLVFFQQLSLVGFAANLIAIPAVTLLITPLALLGIVLHPLWDLAALCTGLLNAVLQWLATPDFAVWSVPAAAPWAAVAGLTGAALLLMPLPRTVRVLGLPLLLPLLWPAVERPAPGAFEMTAVDVGQGTAVLLRTATHTLLYDSGPQYSPQADAGERVLLPLLRSVGERRLDLLVLSHRDTDHVGGAGAVLRGLPVAALRSSLEPGHPLLAVASERGADVARCEAGQRWTWDGVTFALLHPQPDDYAQAATGKAKPNTLSCVLRVEGRWPAKAGDASPQPHVLLLTGDLERAQEARLVAAQTPDAELRSEVLMAPHHGSKTSSSDAFLSAVAPRIAVVQAGYRNRFGHPAPVVLARYAAHGIAVVDSPHCGAWRFGPQGMQCERVVAQRYWQHPDRQAPDTGVAHNGVEVASPQPPEAPVETQEQAPGATNDAPVE